MCGGGGELAGSDKSGGGQPSTKNHTHLKKERGLEPSIAAQHLIKGMDADIVFSILSNHFDYTEK